MSKPVPTMNDKWCPMARLRATDGAYNRVMTEDQKMIYGHALCITDKCAMWVSDGPDAGDCGLKSNVK